MTEPNLRLDLALAECVRLRGQVETIRDMLANEVGERAILEEEVAGMTAQLARALAPGADAEDHRNQLDDLGLLRDSVRLAVTLESTALLLTERGHAVDRLRATIKRAQGVAGDLVLGEGADDKWGGKTGADWANEVLAALVGAE